ncbi:MAG: TonB-dependent receptor [Acidobacteria bacterium]|nr:TonB-dependent receptor [Acidobacteriota bacterium]
MKSAFVRGVLTVLVVLLVPVFAFAQEATLAGSITDSTGGVLPGVTITAVHEASGNTFTTVTDERGEFRLPVRVGGYRVTAELSGFTTVNRALQVLIGQTAELDMQMAPSSVQETVTVTGEVPLVDTTSSTVGANIDPRQVQDLPLNGRNWMDLTLLAPGARRNEGGGMAQFRQGYSQTNVDGQQLTINYHSQTDTEQPGFSRDAIAEFEVVANRFDATQGRSQGMVVNAVTKSGTNTFTASVGGYFRSDKFNAEDFITNRVLPYSNQQVSTTFGGPIRRDRVHFFGAYEYEREPKTYTYTSPYPSFNIDQEFPTKVHKVLGRLDAQFTPQMRLTARVSYFNNIFYAGGGATSHPSAGGTRKRETPQYNGTLTHVLSNRSVNEIRVGVTNYERQDAPSVRWKGGLFPYRPVLNGNAPVIQLRGYSIGANSLNIFQDTQSVRDDFTTSYDWGGRHDVRIGGEYFRFAVDFGWCNRCMGEIDARLGPPPANLESLFPVWNDASTWNLQPLSRLTSQVLYAVSDTEHHYNIVRNLLAGWVQDDWRVGDNVTLNLGVRYDWDSNSQAEKLRLMPFLPGNLPHDNNNVAPRVGVNVRLNDRTVVRGGYGLFFAFSPNDGVQQSYSMVHRFEYQLANDGRPDFVPNWFGTGPGGEGEWGGPRPSWDASLARACDINFVPGCVRRALVQEISYPGRRTPYSHQASVGVQHQIGDTMSVEANYVYTGGRLEETVHNANLTYNPATGANYPFSDISRRPFPEWGAVLLEYLEGYSNYHGTDLTFTKRFSNRWQATATYTLGFFKDGLPVRPEWYLGSDGVMAQRPVGFPLAPDMGGDYGYAGSIFGGGFGQSGDQRHRAVLNGVWDVGYGFQLSGIYFYGSGERFATNTGVDRRGEGVNAASELRLRADGSIAPRAAIIGEPIHRVDARVQKRVTVGGRVTLDGLFEVFNLFNHANYGSYTTVESNARYGQPSFNGNVAYQPRMLQLGFRVGF